jgi:DNA-binding transcriptional MocR family regulator
VVLASALYHLVMDRRTILSALEPWRTGSGPLYRRLEKALRAAIGTGEISAGSGLPSERELARLLDTSRTTVNAAYEILRSSAVLSSRQGSGTWVTAQSRYDRMLGRRPSIGRDAFFRSIIEGTDAPVDLSTALVPASQIVLQALAEFGSVAGASVLASGGYEPYGLHELRRGIAEDLSRRGLPTTTGQILVTTGAQQAITLIADMFVSPRAQVLMESPTYPGAIDVISSRGAAIRSIRMDQEGIMVDRLLQLTERVEPALLYLTPTYHSPSGIEVSSERLDEIVNVVEQRNLTVLEDISLADIPLTATRAELGSLAGRTESPRVLTIGSLSKPFWGGLRIGWTRGPVELIVELARRKAVTDFGSSLVSQLLALRLMEKLREAAEERRQWATSGLSALTDTLAHYLPDWRWTQPRGGASLWVQLGDASATEFAAIALRKGVMLTPGPTFAPEGGERSSLRIPFVADPKVLRSAGPLLRSAWEEYQAWRDSETAPRLVM